MSWEGDCAMAEGTDSMDSDLSGWEMDEPDEVLPAIAEVFERHVATTSEIDYLKIAESFRSFGSAISSGFVHKTRELDLLSEFRALMVRLDSIRTDLNEETSSLLFLVAELIDDHRQEIRETDGASLPFYSDATSGLVNCWNFLNSREPVLQALRETENAISEAPSVGRKPVEAWSVVAAAAFVCRRYAHNIKVPRYMNNSGAFYRLLLDLFEVLDIDETPEGAFRGWSRYVGRHGRENS